MPTIASTHDLLDLLPVVSTVCQMCTALIAASIGVVTFRYTKRQSALTLISHNNTLANAVNNMVITSPEARATLSRLTDVIVGSPDDAVLFLYLNYVHNTFRMRHIGAVSPQVWDSTLTSCAATLRRLSRHQVERLLARGYEPEFQVAVLRRFDQAQCEIVPFVPAQLRAA